MQTFLEIGLSNAVMAAALALLAAGAGCCCRRPAVRHTLWLLVLLKLVTPPLLSIPVTYPLVLDTVLPEGKTVRVRPWPSELERGDPRQAAALDRSSQDGEHSVLFHPDVSAAAAGAFPDRSASDEDEVLAAPASGLASTSLLPFVFTMWLTGAGLWFAVAGTRIYRFQRLLRYGRAAPTPLQDQTRLLAERLGLAHCPTVWVVPGRVSPLLWALGRKLYVVVPADLLNRLGPEERASLLAHELAHAWRRDHWVRWLEFVVSGLYWWLPVAWWARRQLQQAEEECCDAWVVWTLPAAAKAYAKALLQTVDFLDARPALPPVASGVGHVNFLKRRLTMIVRQPLSPCLPWPVHLTVVVLGLLFLPLAPQRLEAQGSEDKPARALTADTALAGADQDSESRDMERRLRILEEKMDRLMQKLDAQGGEKPGGKPSGAARLAEEKAKAAERKAKIADEKARAKEKEKATMKDLKRRLGEGETMSPEQIQRLKDEIYAKVRETQKRIQEEVGKSISSERMEEIQRRVDEALKKSTQQLNEALKKSTEQLERAKKSLQQTKKPPVAEPRPEKFRDQDQRDLERRMDRLEQKLDRVLQALEKQGKPAKF